MSTRFSRWELASLSVIALTAVGGGLLWQSLPPQVAIHFSASGSPGNYVSRTVAVVSMPVLMVLTMLVMKGAARIDPPNDLDAYGVLVCSTMLLLAVVQSFVLGWNLGYRVPFAVFLLVMSLWTVFAVGFSLKHEFTS